MSDRIKQKQNAGDAKPTKVGDRDDYSTFQEQEQGVPRGTVGNWVFFFPGGANPFWPKRDRADAGTVRQAMSYHDLI